MPHSTKDYSEADIKAKSAFLAKLRRLLDLWLGIASGEISTSEGTIAEFSDLIASVLLRSCPSPPASNKWTKLSPALDHFVLGILLRCWHSLYEVGFGLLRSKQRSDALATTTDDVHDPQQEFHRVAGIRLRAALEFHVDAKRAVDMVVLSICSEPLRLLTSFFSAVAATRGGILAHRIWGRFRLRPSVHL
jgi:hypothetical protein